MSVSKSAIVAGVAMAASLAVLGLGIVSARRHYAAKAKAAAAMRAAAKAALAGDGSGDSGDVQLIRFASNPQPVPPFLVNDVEGDMVSTAALHGKVLLINFWATWCPPCREEIPALIRLQNDYKDRLQIIGMSMDEDGDTKAVAEFAKQEGINYPIVMASREMVAESGGVPALPTSFVISPDGRVVQKHVGLYEPAQYEAEVRALLALPVNAKIETFEDTGQIFLQNATLATELPDVNMKGLTPDQRRTALKQMNSDICTCGCGLTVAQCRINDSTCDISKGLAAAIVKRVAAGSSGTGTAKGAPASAGAAPGAPSGAALQPTSD
jgi:thiol-disulfide isomerase/thioredoxin